MSGNHCSGTDAVIKEKKAHLQKEGELEKVRSRRHLDFLDILLFARMQKGSSFSDEDLHAEVDTFMFKGHDTIASGISWILYTLASHPVHQQRCISFRGPPRPDALYHHVHQGGTETLSPSAQQARELSKPITFHEGRVLPAGIILPYPFMGFIQPKGVAKSGGSTRHSHAFLPFSGGFRNFIGKQFSMNELKVAVALTLLRSELAPDPSRVPVPI
ncbi:hypothetical protein MJT46_001530 [Ovis ammon polii x Ovis aries]|nr:hypothetical protein MJT46_001530 [Ovis ammon polii x Ovis aries]